MNPGQEKFYHFIIERVQEDNKDQANELLHESFEKQANGSFDKKYLEAFKPKLVALLKPEHIEEVQAIMKEFGQRNAK